MNNDISIKIWNYRSIPIDSPIQLDLQEGITTILGVNNVGKSNLLKVFYEFRPAFDIIKNNLSSNNPTLTIPEGHQYQPILPVQTEYLYNRFSEIKKIKIEIKQFNHCLNTEIHEGKLYYNFTSLNNEPVNINKALVTITTIINSFYIGALRSGIANTQSTKAYYDIEISSQFINKWSQWQNGDNIHQWKKIKNLIAELKDLFEFKDFNIRQNNDRNNLIVTTDDGDFSIDELGNGIAHIIVTLANVIFKSPEIILIDEPELSLHPKMQETFLRILASKAKYLIATTHSIGLARSASDKIYSLTKLPDKKVKLFPFGKHHKLTIAQSINELGFSQYLELGGNNILLVEGPTDIKSFKEILSKYNINQHFIIMSLGGSDFINDSEEFYKEELVELKRLNANSISVIFDSERTDKNVPLNLKFQRFIDACKGIGFKVFPTEFHSTENYISQNALNKILGESYSKLLPYENFNSKDKKWSKAKNWLMFREMKIDEFVGTELDLFIKHELIPMTKIS